MVRARPCVLKTSFQLFSYLRRSSHMVLSRNLVKTSASIFVPSDGLLRFFVRFALLEPLEDWVIVVLESFS